NISSFLYPYYWGRKEMWYDLTKFTSDDPLHQQFLRAGAARVVVPVRPSFNPDVLFFLITGKLFITGDVPELGEPDYFPITDDILIYELADSLPLVDGSRFVANVMLPGAQLDQTRTFSVSPASGWLSFSDLTELWQESPIGGLPQTGPAALDYASKFIARVAR